MKVLVMSFLIGILAYTDCCNDATCGSIVTKCLLTKACSCDLKTRMCSKECFSCLGYLYSECCNCVDMCPQDNGTSNILGLKSHVEDFIESVPELYSVLTEYPDDLSRWDVTQYPIEIDIQNPTGNKIKIGNDGDSQKYDMVARTNSIILNCTVVFWAQCMSWTKCKSNCMSMGSSSYRWFHDGCCECVGQHCINYGISESSCRLCPLDGDIAIEDIVENDLDYGEDDYEDDYYDEENERLFSTDATSL